VDVGMGCSGPLVVFVVGDRASAWSADERRLLWTAKLDGALAAEAPTPAPAETDLAALLMQVQETHLESTCRTLDVRDGTIAIPLAADRAVRLQLQDGTTVHEPAPRGARRDAASQDALLVR
jgi:hypothetical protein